MKKVAIGLLSFLLTFVLGISPTFFKSSWLKSYYRDASNVPSICSLTDESINKTVKVKGSLRIYPSGNIYITEPANASPCAKFAKVELSDNVRSQTEISKMFFFHIRHNLSTHTTLRIDVIVVGKREFISGLWGNYRPSDKITVVELEQISPIELFSGYRAIGTIDEEGRLNGY